MYASTTIANTIIAKDPTRTALAVIKLVYLAQGWSLAFERPIVADLPEYWQFGPVHPAAYDMLRGFGPNAIPAPQPVPGSTIAHVIPDSDTETHRILQEIVDVHRSYTPVQLSNHCHAAGTPWAVAKSRRGFGQLLHTAIPETEILGWFKARLISHQATSAKAA